MLDSLREALFAQLAAFEHYPRIMAREVCGSAQVDDDDVEWETREVKVASAEEYATLKRIREVLRE